jgi:hypothetical protein
VLCITGNGLKTIDAVAPILPAAPLIAPRVAEVRALVQAASVPGATATHVSQIAGTEIS